MRHCRTATRFVSRYPIRWPVRLFVKSLLSVERMPNSFVSESGLGRSSGRKK